MQPQLIPTQQAEFAPVSDIVAGVSRNREPWKRYGMSALRSATLCSEARLKRNLGPLMCNCGRSAELVSDGSGWCCMEAVCHFWVSLEDVAKELGL